MRTPGQYELTIIDGSGLLHRLTTELNFLADEAKATWPEFKRNPIGLAGRVARECCRALGRFFSAPNRLFASVTAVLVITVALMALFVLGSRKRPAAAADESLELVQVLNFAASTAAAKDTGVGASSQQGRVGFNDGKGEGSNVTPSKVGGGGGGGMHDSTEAQQGRIPLPSAIPAPIPKLASSQSPTLPEAGIDIDPALYKALPFRTYGDPRSASTTPSNGPGDGGGMGNTNGQGIGDGKANGVGPGDGGNMGEGPRSIGARGDGGSNGSHVPEPPRVFPNSQTSQRARIVEKPEPQYTEDARRNQVTGTVVLRVVFSSSGQVTNIRTVSALPDGLTDRAIAAARRIKFVPALMNGQPVSVYFQLEYNFNLY